MSSAFSKNNVPETQVKRNTFDGSFQNNLTMKMGYLYPCMCKEVIPGDTFNIKSYLGLRFMPTFFPIQSKVKARLEFFYVRSRNLWKNFQNYYTGIGSHDGFPVLSPTSALNMSRTGSLGDYLGLPSTVVTNSSVGVNCKPYFTLLNGNPFGNVSFRHLSSLSYSSTPKSFTSHYDDVDGTKNGDVTGKFVTYSTLLYLRDPTKTLSYTLTVKEILDYGKTRPVINFPEGQHAFYHGTYYELPFKNLSSSIYNIMKGSETVEITGNPPLTNSTYLNSNLYVCPLDSSTTVPTFLSSVPISSDIPGAVDGTPLQLFYFLNGKVYINSSVLDETIPNAELLFAVTSQFTSDALYQISQGSQSPNDYAASNFPTIAFNFSPDTVVEASSVIDEVPYAISALPFRAYEQIYNSFYRDDRNNPFILPNGEFDPNKFIPYDDGGVDDYNYTLHKRNWEQDFLSTALPSPQYGNAPLVGISTNGDASFITSDGSTVTTKLSTDDNDTVVGFKSTSDPSVNRSLVELATSGISIADLRATNALQRYLEITYRRGLRYKDQILSHFGVDIKADILDMPEFLGGSSTIVDVSQINQTSSSGSDPLGSYAGQMSAYGESSSIRHYFDEPGYVIGIISVVPVPTYSQLVPKHFLKTRERLDFYMPEFGHLGYQPIRYDEVCPLQAKVQEASLSTVYGYQRAWYDYLANVDEIHGLFRTNLSHFVLSRVFKDLPSLNEDFLTVDPESLNEVFSVNSVDGEPIDTILGQIHFDIKMNRPIPRYSIPSIE